MEGKEGQENCPWWWLQVAQPPRTWATFLSSSQVGCMASIYNQPILSILTSASVHLPLPFGPQGAPLLLRLLMGLSSRSLLAPALASGWLLRPAHGISSLLASPTLRSPSDTPQTHLLSSLSST